MSRDITFVELTALFANRALTAPAFALKIAGCVRRGPTRRGETLRAIERLDGSGPPRWHESAEIIAVDQRVNRRYPSGAIRRLLSYDLIGRATMNHVATYEVERRDGCIRRV